MWLFTAVQDYSESGAIEPFDKDMTIPNASFLHARNQNDHCWSEYQLLIAQSDNYVKRTGLTCTWAGDQGYTGSWPRVAKI